jgi:ferric-dicitrate binding protein FerR (iron transport regulator)
VELTPNEQMIYEKQSQQINTETVNTDIYTSWVRGEYIFQNENLEVIMKRIERWYDIEVIINDPNIAQQRLSGRFRDEEPLDQVLEVIKLTTPINYTVKEKVVIIDIK